MKRILTYIIFVSIFLVTSCSKIEQPTTEVEAIHPEGCTPVDIELLSPTLTRAALNNDNIDYYYLIVDQADETDAAGSINGTTYDYVLKVKRNFIPVNESADAYKNAKHNGEWDRWEVYEMIIDGSSGKVVEGPKRSAPIYLYDLDRVYYYNLATGANPDPSENNTPNIVVTAVKWDAKDSEIFKVSNEGRIVLNDEDIAIDLSSTNPYDIYANDLIYSVGGKENIALNDKYVLSINPQHQFSLIEVNLDFIQNFRNIYYHGTSYSGNNYPLTNTKGGEHESVIHSLDVNLKNPIEYATGFNLSTGALLTQQPAVSPYNVDIDLGSDVYHIYPKGYYDSSYQVIFQILVSPNQMAANASEDDYNLDIKVTTKKFEVDSENKTYTMDGTKKDREFIFNTKTITKDSFGSNKSLNYKFTIGDNYDY